MELRDTVSRSDSEEEKMNDIDVLKVLGMYALILALMGGGSLMILSFSHPRRSKQETEKNENEEETMNSKTRLYVDMDGTLAVFKVVDHLEQLYAPDYFRDLEPHENVVEAIRLLQRTNQYDIYIMSSVLSDSPHALQEKNEWLDQHLPEIPAEKRIFPPCGKNKLSYVPGGVRKNDCLLDDYSQNLRAWEPPAVGVKLMNGINGTRGSWQGRRIQYDVPPTTMADELQKMIRSSERGKEDDRQR